MALGFVEGSSAAGGFLERLERAERLEDLQAVSEALRDLYQGDHLIYHWVSASGDPELLPMRRRDTLKP